MNIKSFCTFVAASAIGVAVYEGAKGAAKHFGKAWAAARVAASDNNETEDAPAAEAPKPETKKPADKAPDKKDGQGKKDDKPTGKQDNGKKGDKKPETAGKK
jgi:hypothetical protein